MDTLTMANDRQGSDTSEQLRVEIVRLQKENEKLRASNRRWMRIAGTDDLTGLPNKIYFTTALLPQVVSQANASGQSFVCVMVAPDKLGDINQRFGREGGDQVVEGLAAFLRENIETDEKIVHFDGSNFVIIIPDATDDDRKRRTRQIRARVVSRHFECGGEAVTLTLSMGTVIRGPNAPGTEGKTKDIADDIIRRMGSALDSAKKKGGDQVVDDDGSGA
ncbi:MAG: diguanylate cyclase (GGDEF)-like protein [Planctomycetota bacterium]|jgi:diguanylate cyclase (GGDEF)-like protein